MNTHVVHFFGDINNAAAGNLCSVVIGALNQGAEKIKIQMTSTGGNIVAGFGIYNYPRSLPVPFSMHNFGNVDSIAVIVFLAADERYVVPHGRFLLHPSTWTYAPNSTCVDQPRLQEHSENLAFDVRRYAAIFKERTASAKVPVDIEKHLQNEALFIDAAAALDTGIATEILSPEGTTPKGCTHWWVSSN